MDDKKKQAIHKQAVLEFLYTTAAQAVAHASLVLINRNEDHDSADRLLKDPLGRTGFASMVSDELRDMGAPTLPDAPVSAVEQAATKASLRITKLASTAVHKQAPKRKRNVLVVVELPEGVPTDAVPVLPKSNDFGAN